MSQKGTASVIPILVIVLGLVIGVYFINEKTGFLSNAFEIIGPSKSAIIKIPLKPVDESRIATNSAQSATASAKPKMEASTASPSASPK